MILPAKKARNREWNGVEGWGFGDTGVVVLSPLRVKERRRDISGSNNPPLPESAAERSRKYTEQARSGLSGVYYFLGEV